MPTRISPPLVPAKAARPINTRSKIAQSPLPKARPAPVHNQTADCDLFAAVGGQSDRNHLPCASSLRIWLKPFYNERMGSDDKICYCYNVPYRKLWSYACR